MGKINKKSDKKKVVKNVVNENIKTEGPKDKKLKGIAKHEKDQINTTIKKANVKNTFSLAKKAEFAAKAEAKAARIKTQKAKRLEKTIIISKKTKRGQPLMKDRINYLLKKIQDSKN